MSLPPMLPGARSVQPVSATRPTLFVSSLRLPAGRHDNVALDAAHHVEIDHGDRLVQGQEGMFDVVETSHQAAFLGGEGDEQDARGSLFPAGTRSGDPSGAAVPDALSFAR